MIAKTCNLMKGGKEERRKGGKEERRKEGKKS